MTENEAKNGNKDYLVDKLQESKDSDRTQNGVLNFRFDKQNSFVQQCSPRETGKSYDKMNDSTAASGFSKKSSGLRLSKDNSHHKKMTKGNKESDDSSGVSTKTTGGSDPRNFKSMTIDRMGKMLKLKSSNFDHNEFELPTQEGETRRVSFPCDQPSHKEKTNSLGRMLKLMDKDVGPRRIFGQSKSESANRFWKTKSSIGEEEKPKSDDRIRRAFSKMLSQIRGRSRNANTSSEPNIRTSEGKSKVSLSHISTSRSSLSPTKNRTSLSLNPTSSTSGIPEHPV